MVLNLFVQISKGRLLQMIKNEMAICIDFWFNGSKNTPDWINNTINFIDQRQEIGTVVLATYDTGLESLNREGLDWYINRDLILHDNLPVPTKWIQTRYQAAVRYTPWNPWIKEQFTHPALLHAGWEGKHKIAMHWWYQLEYYLKLHPHYNAIWIFGCEFNQCCKTREIGWQYGPTLTGMPWFTNSNCICDPHWLGKLENWQHAHDTIWRYV